MSKSFPPGKSFCNFHLYSRHSRRIVDFKRRSLFLSVHNLWSVEQFQYTSKLQKTIELIAPFHSLRNAHLTLRKSASGNSWLTICDLWESFSANVYIHTGCITKIVTDICSLQEETKCPVIHGGSRKWPVSPAIQHEDVRVWVASKIKAVVKTC